ncbi:uncharacterized protein LOC130735125 [Lotus japonicus]|uniref:uncharacterized protein LOC130735125 n=1 Tax=Lotus japonicus TaxID=34305 RepID=UPI0025841B4C|nr:uncharacterized protein LOC130735125 [Lotus japonicus]
MSREDQKDETKDNNLCVETTGKFVGNIRVRNGSVNRNCTPSLHVKNQRENSERTQESKGGGRRSSRHHRRDAVVHARESFARGREKSRGRKKVKGTWTARDCSSKLHSLLFSDQESSCCCCMNVAAVLLVLLIIVAVATRKWRLLLLFLVAVLPIALLLFVVTEIYLLLLVHDFAVFLVLL